MRFYSGVELHRHAALFTWTVAGRFAAAEGNMVIDACGWGVDHDHARLHVAAELVGVFQ